VLLVPHGEEDRDVAARDAGVARRKAWSAPPPLSGAQSQAEKAATEQERGGEREVHGSAGHDSLFEGGLDLAGMRKAAGLLLGEDQLVADGDLEDSAGSFDELGFDAELLLDLLRQTGGARKVVSDSAVLDGDTDGHDPPSFRPGL
jgi:hypothetical protein